MVDEVEQFQQDLLEAVRQMKAGEIARLSQRPLSAAEDKASKDQAILDWEALFPLSPPVQGTEICCSPQTPLRLPFPVIWKSHKFQITLLPLVHHFGQVKFPLAVRADQIGQIRQHR